MTATYTNNFISDAVALNIESTIDELSVSEGSSTLKSAVAIAAFAFCMGAATASPSNYVGVQVTGNPNTLISVGTERKKDDDESLFLYAGFPWMTQDLLDFMLDNQTLSPMNVDWLRNTLYTVFGDSIELEFRTHTDPEEGWTKVILAASTGIDDLEERINKEDNFFAIVDRDPALKSALRHTIISFS